MKTVVLTAGQASYTITACVVLCGNDAAVVIGGGEAPHIGAVALGSPRPSLKNADPVLQYCAGWGIKTICLPVKLLCCWRLNSTLM